MAYDNLQMADDKVWCVSMHPWIQPKIPTEIGKTKKMSQGKVQI